MPKSQPVQMSKSKSKKLSITIKVDPLRVSDKDHVRACEKFPTRVYEDKRFKKPKHKEDYKNF